MSLLDTFSIAWESVQGVEGWMSIEQGEALFLTARNIAPGTAVVEIGSHMGRSTIILATAKPPGACLIAVDPWGDPRWGGGADSLRAFRTNLQKAGVEKEVEVYRGVSETALKEWHPRPIGLLYIDGAHDLRSVLLDIDGWEPFVAEGGTVCIHDAFSSVGVTRAILKRHLLNKNFRYAGAKRSLAIYKRERLSTSAAVWSTFRQVCRLSYFARNLVVKVARRRNWRAVSRLLRHHEPSDPY